VVAALAIGGALLAAMVATAGYAARTLPPGARVPLNAGVPEHSVWLPRLAGLAAWLGAGAAAFAALAALTLSGLAANWAQSLRVVLLPGVMTVVLAAEAGAVIVARRQAGGAQGSDTPGSEPGTDQAVTEQAGTDQAGSDAPGTEQPGTEQAGAEQAGAEEQPGAGAQAASAAS
jgi:hypothetical protein